MRLWILARRTLALPFGRGAFTLGTADPLPTEPLSIPKVSLAGRLVELNGAEVNLDPRAIVGPNAPAVDQDLVRAGKFVRFGAIRTRDDHRPPALCTWQMNWPDFNNGVAAGLRLRRNIGDMSWRTWILYNRPAKPTWAHAGFVFGLGLAGTLGELSVGLRLLRGAQEYIAAASCARLGLRNGKEGKKGAMAATQVPDVYDYLRQEHAATTIAVLLGMAASRRGSMDPAVYKMLFLHVPNRHPSSFPDIEISPLVQSAAILGAGLLYQGTGHRLMCEMLLDELGDRPGVLNTGGSDGGVVGTGNGQITNSRECYALSAGLALGLVTLGKGRNAPGLADMGIEDRLRSLMVGGTDPLLPGGASQLATGRPAGSFGADSAASVRSNPPWDPSGLLSQGSGVSGQDRGTGAGGGSTSGSFGAGDRGEDRTGGTNPHLVIEGSRINADVVGPGATLALALMYLRTNDEEVASRFSLPDSIYALDFVRPEVLTLRCLSRGLVLWDRVQPTAKWLDDSLPQVMDRMALCVGTSAPSLCI